MFPAEGLNGQAIAFETCFRRCSSSNSGRLKKSHDGGQNL